MSKARLILKGKFYGKDTISTLCFLHCRRQREMHKRLQFLELRDGTSFKLCGMYITKLTIFLLNIFYCHMFLKRLCPMCQQLAVLHIPGKIITILSVPLHRASQNMIELET
jgi:hypothetical protein